MTIFLFYSICAQMYWWLRLLLVRSFFLFILRRKSLSQCVHGFFQQTLSVCNVTLPPVGPVQLQPLLLSLGVLQHSLPPQALPGLGTELWHVPLRWSCGFIGRCQQSQWILWVFLVPAATASEPVSILLIGGSERGQLASGLTEVCLAFLCREPT